jgi:hypothetical protein
MADTAEMVAGARTRLRDFPHFFETDLGPLNILTVRLPHPLVSASSLQVYAADATASPAPLVLTDKWQLDERNGMLKITDDTLLGKKMVVAGYYFSWFLDSDLSYHIGNVTDEITASGRTEASLSEVEWDVVVMGGAVQALWSLAVELSLDIDVSTPEGMYIPARQRFTQVIQMMQYLENEYNNKAAMLNIGLNALEIFRLRRVAYLTNRYVPVYREREIDDRRPPQRLYPPIPYGAPTRASQLGDVVEEIEEHTFGSSPEEVGREGSDLGFGGWTSIGTSG